MTPPTGCHVLLPKKTRHHESFNLDDGGDAKSYNDLLQDPEVTFIEKKEYTKTFSEFEGSSHTELYLYVEYERCAL